LAKPSLLAIPLGGLGEFGMNMLVLRSGDDMILIDAGMMFPEAELLGVDIVIPTSPTSSRTGSTCAPSC
jgi:ribonuclease J